MGYDAPMRIAVLSDIHANLRAWNAVLTDIGSLGADRILCLGDLVGYGPSPAEVLRSAYRHVHGFVLGNHDAVVAGKMSPDVFNDRARRLILWTRGQVGANGARFLGTLPLVLSGNGMRCAHANFVRPSAFDYLAEPEDAAASWAVAPEPLLFVGHTHVPQLFVVGASGTPHVLEPQDFTLEEGKRYIVNVGAVGVPRDADARASYVLWDDVARTVEFRRVPFDMDAFREDVQRAGLDPADVPLLSADPRRHLAAIREDADFAPPRRAEDEARGVVVEADLATALRRRASRWRIAALAALAAALLAAAAGALLLRREATAALVVPSRAPDVRLAYARAGENVLPPWPQYLDADGGLGDRGVRLDDRRRQSLAIATVDDGPLGVPVVALRIVHSHGRAAVRVESPWLDMPPEGPRDIVLTAFARPREDFSGMYAVALEYPDADGTRIRSEPKSFTGWGVKDKSWSGARLTEGVPKMAARFRVVLTGEFDGTLDVSDISLARR